MALEISKVGVREYLKNSFVNEIDILHKVM